MTDFKDYYLDSSFLTGLGKKISIYIPILGIYKLYKTFRICHSTNYSRYFLVLLCQGIFIGLLFMLIKTIICTGKQSYYLI